MKTAQDWLNKNYPINSRHELTELNLASKKLKGVLSLEGFINLRVLIVDKNKLKELNLTLLKNLRKLSCKDNLLENLDVSKNKELMDLDCSINKLASLDVSGLIDLEKISCYYNQLTSLKTDGCNSLAGLFCSHNKFANEEFLTKLPSPERLIYLDISDNDSAFKNLESLESFVNLENLHIEKWDKKKPISIHPASLKPLEKLTKLKNLSINNNDNISEVLENLPESLEDFVYDGCKEVSKQLKEHKSKGNFKEVIKAWRDKQPFYKKFKEKQKTVIVDVFDITEPGSSTQRIDDTNSQGETIDSLWEKLETVLLINELTEEDMQGIYKETFESFKIITSQKFFINDSEIDNFKNLFKEIVEAVKGIENYDENKAKLVNLTEEVRLFGQKMQIEVK